MSLPATRCASHCACRGQGEREAALAHLQRLRPASGEVPVALEEALRSLDTQAWQERGLVERAVAVVINARMKKRGMRWKRANAHAVVALRVHYLNAQWEAVA